MFSNKWVAFGVGIAAGVAAAAVVRTPAFRKACVAVLEKSIQLKEDVQDMAAEAAYNQTQNA